MSDLKLQTGISLINKDLKLEENELGISISSQEELIKKLTRVIRFLLDHDFERLLTAFYRIDLSEETVNQILHLEDPEKIPLSLATKVVERELLKAEYRLKYKS